MLVFTDDMENLIRDAVEHQTSLTIDIGDHMQLAFYPDPHGEADAVYALADLPDRWTMRCRRLPAPSGRKWY